MTELFITEILQSPVVCYLQGLGVPPFRQRRQTDRQTSTLKASLIIKISELIYFHLDIPDRTSFSDKDKVYANCYFKKTE